MRRKGLLTIFIIIVFMLVSVFSIFSAFSIKQVKVEYKVSGFAEEYTDNTQLELNAFKGKSLLFLKQKSIEDKISKYTYLEIESISKQYPSTLSISVKEREEAYFINYDGHKYILDETGFVVNKDESNNENLLVEIKGVNIESIEVGKKVSVIEKELFDVALCTSSLEHYTSNVKAIEIKSGTELSDIVFYMTTGVEITVTKADKRGLEKIDLGFSCYDNQLSDYDKYKEYVLVFELDSGVLQVTHSAKN